MDRIKRGWFSTPKRIRQVLVLIVGFAVIIAGIIMLAIPGPGWLTIFVGLAILATEFEVAERLKKKAETRARGVASGATAKVKRLRKK